jgi:hypothetical protein
MLPFRFQIVSVAHHSRGAIEAVKNGVFIPSGGKPDLDYAALQALVTEARNELSVLTPEQVRRPDVVLAADLLFPCDHGLRHSRHKGAPLGKRDFMGRLKLRW